MHLFKEPFSLPISKLHSYFLFALRNNRERKTYYVIFKCTYFKLPHYALMKECSFKPTSRRK